MGLDKIHESYQRIYEMKYLDSIITVISDHSGISDGYMDEDTILLDIGVDEESMSDLAILIEDCYGIEMSDEDVEDSKTIGDLAGIVEAKMKVESAYE
jgi:acyl carrier protein